MAKKLNNKELFMAYGEISMMVFLIIAIILEYGFGIHIGF